MRSLFLALFSAAALWAGAPAVAQDWPAKPIRLVVPGPPGNSSDIYARYFAGRLTTLLGQPVTVENRAGGNGFIGATTVTQAPPDGYTVFIAGSSPMAQNMALFKSMPYDPVKDFRWISGIFEGMAVLVVPANSPYTTVNALIAAAKAQPKKLNYGSYAAAYRLSTEWFNQATGIQTSFIPYKGAPQVTTDLIGGQLDFAMVDSVAVAPLIQGGQLRALVVTGDERHPLLPQTPTLREAGLPAYGKSAWVSVAVRADTPNPIAAKLTATMMKILAEPATKEFSDKQGAFLLAYDDKQMSRFHASEIEKYKKIAAAAHIPLE
ncbi:Bug family tripartite tricarboxylate transporter substrate binding protein [Ottowia sp. VDI28]|uniref:Bug family tripartite tricarboxylate transporter substrate binding protein n=1 Tax=Ottowia sp. VDI28 TaxID=3133968 RepID=UPI003C2CAF61